MKSSILSLLLFVSLYTFAQQKHFSISLALHMQSDSIFCDLISNDDYPLTGMQFGFHHNSADLKIIGIQAQTLPDINQADIHEVCPQYVRLLWTDTGAKNFQIKRGDVLLSLIYKEVQSTSHFICMMLSGDGQHERCETFQREATYFVSDTSFDLIDYIVDDVCINYKIDNGQPLILATNNYHISSITTYVNEQGNGLVINDEQGIRDNNTYIQMFNLNGNECMSQLLQQSTSQTIDLSELHTGLYFYQISNSKGKLKTGKVFLK